MGVFSCISATEQNALASNPNYDDDMYKSAFTYNTESEFANEYQSVDAAVNGYNNVDNFDPVPRPDAPAAPLSSRIVEGFLVSLSVVFLTLTFPITLFFCLKSVSSFERLVTFRVGRMRKVYSEGTVLTLPFVDKSARIDVRPSTLEITPLQLITSDRGIVEIRAALMMRVVDAVRVVCSIQSQNQAALDIARTTLHNQLVRLTVADISHERTRTRVLGKVCNALNAFLGPRGLEIGDVTIIDMKIIKQPENQTLSLFSQLLSSDVGKQLVGALGSQAAELLKTVPPPKTVDGSFDWSRLAAAATASMSPSSTATTMPATSAPSSPSVSSPPTNGDIDKLVSMLNQCCDSTLVAKVGCTYRVLCEHDAHIYTLDLDLRTGRGSCRLNSGVESSSTSESADVTFALSYETLVALIRGEMSPLSAYINGSVKLVGSITDALSLNYVATRAKELNLTI